MKTILLWMITILGISGLCLLFHAPFLGAFWALVLLCLSLITSKTKKGGSLPRPIGLPFKVILALLFVLSIGYSLHIYLTGVVCLHCLHGVLSANIPRPLYGAEQDFIIFLKSTYLFAPKVCWFFALLGAAGALHVLYHLRGKKKNA